MKLLVRTYASLLILYGLINTTYLLAVFFFKNLFPPELIPYLGWCETAALVSGMALIKTPFNFIIGYGLLRFRPWSRFGVLAGIATLPVLIVTERLWWGPYRLGTISIVLLLVSVCITLILFTRSPVKEMFDDKRPFRLVGLKSSVSAGIVLLAFVPILCSLATKMLTDKIDDVPEIRKVADKIPSSPPEGFRVVRFMDSYLPVFDDSYIMNYNRIGFGRNPWRFSFRGKKGFIEYCNHSIYDEAFKDFPFIEIRGFELEEFFLTNQWNPLVLVLRSISRPIGSRYEVREIESGDTRGFVTLLDDKIKKGKRRISATFSLFGKKDGRCRSGILTMQVEQTAVSDEILPSLISSVRFLDPENRENAASHFQQGKKYLKEEKKLAGQVELAEAYYLASDNKYYRGEFEATLSKMFRELPHTWQDLKASPLNR